MVIKIKTVSCSGRIHQGIADTERWLHAPEAQAQIEESLEWLRQNPPRATDLAEIEGRLTDHDSE